LPVFFANGHPRAKRISAKFGYVTLNTPLSGQRKIAQVSAISRKSMWRTPAKMTSTSPAIDAGTGMPVVRWTLSTHPGNKNGANEHGAQG
jgi:hypothetical protein